MKLSVDLFLLFVKVPNVTDVGPPPTTWTFLLALLLGLPAQIFLHRLLVTLATMLPHVSSS
jgi:hypothetical protein